METRDGPSGGGGQDSAESSLWSTILASTDRRTASASGPGGASGSQAASSRRLLVLGGHDSGKSTVIKALGRTSTSNGNNNHNINSAYRSSIKKDKGKATASPAGDTPDLGLNFQYIDLADEGEGDEDASSRLSVYQMPSTSNAMHTPLLPLALSRDILLDTLAMIILDWEKPWTFVRDLQRWFSALHALVNDIEQDKEDVCGPAAQAQASRRRKGKYVVDEGREMLETCLRSYQEPSNKDNTASALPLGAASKGGDDRLPLSEGTLTSNLGCSIIVVCTKADHIQTLERSAHLTEDLSEYIQQTLRTICLQYGAALFFTSQYHPSQYEKLRAYVQHRLHASAALQAQGLHGAGTDGDDQPASGSAIAVPGAASTSRHPFPYRANAVDREQLCIPTGWDSYGKIRILRDSFDCGGVRRGWALDLGFEDPEDTPESGRRISLLELYERTIVDVDAQQQLYQQQQQQQQGAGTHGRKSGSGLEVQDEQDFLRAHYEMLGREAAKQREAQLAKQQAAAAAAAASSLPPPLQTSGAGRSPLLSPGQDVSDVAKKFFGATAGVVGPMSSSSLSLPTVERALDRDSSTTTGTLSTVDATARPGGLNRREPSRPSSSLANGVASPSPPLPSSPPLTSPSSGSQNAVLANFFQSLLNSKTDGSTRSSTASPAGYKASSGTGAGSARNSVDLSKSTIRRDKP